jgi:hypothetical protein
MALSVADCMLICCVVKVMEIDICGDKVIPYLH